MMPALDIIRVKRELRQMNEQDLTLLIEHLDARNDQGLYFIVFEVMQERGYFLRGAKDYAQHG